jgi:hypothetical protein
LLGAKTAISTKAKAHDKPYIENKKPQYKRELQSTPTNGGGNLTGALASIEKLLKLLGDHCKVCP